MAGRPRLPSSSLGTDSSSPTPAKRPRESSRSPTERASSEDTEPSNTSSNRDLTCVEPEKSYYSPTSTETFGSTGSTEEAATESRSHGRVEGEIVSQSGTATFHRESSEETLPVPSTSSEEPRSGGLDLAASGSAEAGPSTASEVMEVRGGGGSTNQASLMGESAHYRQLSLIGNGAYGKVYRATDATNGQVVALKKVRVPHTEDGLPTSTLREITALKQLESSEHPHIVRLLDVCLGDRQDVPSGDERSARTIRALTLWLVFEHVARDLASYILASRPLGLPARTIERMSREILLGVDFLHSHRIVHRDLKPHNLLVTNQGTIKIADFGLAKTYDFEMRLTSVVVTLWYRAPEVLLGCPYATPVDLWSVGCILAELNLLEALFQGTSEGDQLDRIFQVIGTPPQQEWPENVSLSWTAFPYRQPRSFRSMLPDLSDAGLDLIKRILTFDPNTRLSAAQALEHRYFSRTIDTVEEDTD